MTKFQNMAAVRRSYSAFLRSQGTLPFPPVAVYKQWEAERGITKLAALDMAVSHLQYSLQLAVQVTTGEPSLETVGTNGT